MEKERIAILKAELGAQVGEIENIYVRLDERSKKRGKAAAECIGYQLHNLRSFRHFFRHAYSYDLDERKVRIVLSDAFKLRDLYQKDIRVFWGSF